MTVVLTWLLSKDHCYDVCSNHNDSVKMDASHKEAQHPIIHPSHPLVLLDHYCLCHWVYWVQCRMLNLFVIVWEPLSYFGVSAHNHHLFCNGGMKCGKSYSSIINVGLPLGKHNLAGKMGSCSVWDFPECLPIKGEKPIVCTVWNMYYITLGNETVLVFTDVLLSCSVRGKKNPLHCPSVTKKHW